MSESSKRSAHATIRGYLYQTCLGVQRWLDLQPNEILVCEGDEDLDRHVLEGVSIFEQVKDYSGGLGLADPAVKETLDHFLVRYVDLRKTDQSSRFLFTTTARPKRRQVDKDFDLLDAWRNGERGKKVVAGARALFKDSESKDVAKAKAWLTRQRDGWKGFLDAVEWSFDAPDLDRIRGEIRTRLARREDTRLLHAEIFLDRLIVEVLSASSRKDVHERTFTPKRLSDLVETSRRDLASWASTAPAIRVQKVFEEATRFGQLLNDNTDQLPANPTPGQLLTAAYEVIPFEEKGRREELEILKSWCEEGEPRRSVLLLTGEGGSGKTRLMIEWCRRLRHQGWYAGFLRRDRTRKKELDSLLKGTTPRLVIIDYAETRLEVVEPLLLKMALTSSDEGPPMRLVLLTRRVGDWWSRLHRDRDIRNLLARSREAQRISPLVSEPEERPGVFLATREAFAGQLDLEITENPPPDLRSRDYERVLYLHMAALVSLKGGRIESATDALEQTLHHEEQFWDQAVRDLRLKRLPLESVQKALGPAMAAVTLAGGAASKEKAKALIRLAPWLSLPSKVSGPVLRTLEQLYRATSERYLDPLQPDILGEQLVAGQLKQNPELLGRFLDGAESAEVSSGLTVLTRLAQRRPEAVEWLRLALQSRFPALWKLALEVSVETGEPMGQEITQAFELTDDPPLAWELMETCNKIEYRDSVLLRELALSATVRSVEALRLDSDDPQEEQLEEQARLANNLGYRLSDLGRREDALQATQQAVDIRRQLAETRPDAFRPYLASSLNNLGTMLSELGRREDALQATQQAVDTYRQIAETKPDAFRPDLASSLNNLGTMLSKLGRREDALQATQQAVDTYRQLAETRPGAFRPHLASSLNNLGAMLSELGRHEDALQVAQQAVDIRRQLAETRPDAFRPRLASSLNNLGNRLSDLGRHEDALAAADEAVRTLSPFFLRYPDAFRDWIHIVARNYLKYAKAVGVEPDAQLLRPILALLILENSASDAPEDQQAEEP